MKKIMGIFNNYKGLPGSIYVLFFASIANNLGNFVMPFLTMFLTYRVGIEEVVVGVIVAVNSGLGMLGSLIGGKLVDSSGRKSTFVIFRMISAISVISCAFIKSPIIVVVLLMAATFFGGFTQPVYSTMIADLTEGNQRKVAFSLEYMAINIGAAVGPLVAAFLYENYITWLFLGDGITTIISVILVGTMVPETFKRGVVNSKMGGSLEKEEEGSLFTALIKRPALAIFSLIMVIYFIVFSQFNFGLSLQIGEVFGEIKAPMVFGSLMTINAVMCSIFTAVVVSFTKETDSALTIALGGIFYTIGFGMMFFISGYYMFVISTVIWTIGEILVANNTNTYISAHTPASHRGRFNSIFPIIRRLGFMGGPLIAGVCVKFMGIRQLWLIIGVMAIIGAGLMYRLRDTAGESKLSVAKQ